MAFQDFIKQTLAGASSLKEPVFLKEDTSAEAQLKKMRQLLLTVDQGQKAQLESDIKKLEMGIYGENKVGYELKSSFIPMFVIPDLCLEHNGITAQIDYLVLTKKNIFVIECKNLWGNIMINNRGDFVRIVGNKKVGMYNPITQNQRHLEIIKQVRKEAKTNVLTQYMFERNFEDVYKSLIVLANDKTVVQDYYAPKEIKNQILRYDRLNAYIKDSLKNSKVEPSFDASLRATAEFFLSKHVDKARNYYNKYEKTPATVEKAHKPTEKQNSGSERVFIELRSYRYQQSKKENIPPYYIFNDNQLNELIKLNPKSTQELMRVSGFGPKKNEKYGKDILELLAKYNF